MIKALFAAAAMTAFVGAAGLAVLGQTHAPMLLACLGMLTMIGAIVPHDE